MTTSTDTSTDTPGIATLPRAPERLLPLDGCVNFRDLGGYRTTDGRQVRWRRLFRADGLGCLSSGDRQRLAGLGLATVVDLRTGEEAEQRGRFPATDLPVRYAGLPLTDVLPSNEELPDWKEASFVASRYLSMVESGGAVLTEAINMLAEDGALPAVMHCSAGKDRTGVLAALILAFLRVPDGTIVEDYTLSGPAMVRLLARLKAEYPDSKEAVERFAPAILQVAPESMAAFLDQVRGPDRGYDGLAERLGVIGAVDRLRRTLLEPA